MGTLLMRYFCLLLLFLLPQLLVAQYSVPYHLDTARSYLNVRELTGRNDGVEVEKFLRYVGLAKGNPWCAAFVSYCIGKSGATEPKVKSGLARRFITRKSLSANEVYMGIRVIRRGAIVVWRRGNTIFGHVGIAETHITKGGGFVIEGNTTGGRAGAQHEGDGVYRRWRKIEPYNYFRITNYTIVRYE